MPKSIGIDTPVAGLASGEREGDGLSPPLLRARHPLARVGFVLVPPVIFGGICGIVLGVDKTAYVVLTLLALVGGYYAGQEHDRAVEGALRGLIGGGLFGGAILAAHAIAGTAEKTKLPHPHVILVAATVVFGVAAGIAGARRRVRRREDKRELVWEWSRLDRAEAVAFLGSAVLFGSMFLSWFSTSCNQQLLPHGCNVNSELRGMRGSFDAFQTFRLLDWLLVASCVAPFVLAYLIVRGYDLTWRPGEITMIVGIVAFVLILMNGIILGRPGGTSPHNVAISLEIGYPVGILGAALIGYGGFLRQTRSITSMKPPGVM